MAQCIQNPELKTHDQDLFPRPTAAAAVLGSTLVLDASISPIANPISMAQNFLHFFQFARCVTTTKATGKFRRLLLAMSCPYSTGQQTVYSGTLTDILYFRSIHFVLE